MSDHAPMSVADSRTRRLPLVWAALVLVAVGVAVYFPLLGYGSLNWDDHETVFANPDFHPVTLSGLLRYWRTPHLSLYIPMTYTWWWGLAWLSPGHSASVVVFRVGSVLLHLGSGWLVFWICREILGGAGGMGVKGRAGDLSSLAAAAYFLAAPTQVESVAWISGQKDLLAGLLALLSLACQVRYWRARSGSVAWGTAAVASFGLALLAKPAVVSAPIGFAALGVVAAAGARRRVLSVNAALLLVALPVMMIAKQVQPAPDVFVPSLLERLEVAGFSLGFYLLKLAWPWHLSMDYGHHPGKVVSYPGAGFFLFLLAVFIAAAVLAFWRGPKPLRIAGALLTLFAAPLAPVLGLVPFEFQDYSTVADHYLYLATLASALGVAILLDRWPRLAAVVVVGIVALAIRSAVYVPVWRDNSTLFAHVLKETPNSLAAHRTLAFLAARSGDLATARRHYEAALSGRPGDFIANYNLANQLRAGGDPAGALVHYERAAAAKPGHAVVQNNLAITLAQMGRAEEALVHFERAIALDANWADPLANAGLVALQLDRRELARGYFLKALALDPGHPQGLAGLSRVGPATAPVSR